MGSGKSTIGHLLARRIGGPFVDNDEALEARSGRTARAIADAEGADALHVLEAQALVDALAGPDGAVVAAAASVVEQPPAVAALRRNAVVYLHAPPAVLAARVAAQAPGDDHRPFVDRDVHAVLEQQYAARDALYRSVADIVFDTSENAPGEIVEAVMRALAPAGPRTPPGS